MRETIILIADDDKADRLFLKKALIEINSSVKILEVKDGEELISYLSNPIEDIHLIISDINMPRRNGFEVMEYKKDQGMLNNVPVLFFSTSSDIDDINKAMELGVKEYITKPSSIIGYTQVANRILDIISESRPLLAQQLFFLMN